MPRNLAATNNTRLRGVWRSLRRLHDIPEPVNGRHLFANEPNPDPADKAALQQLQ